MVGSVFCLLILSVLTVAASDCEIVVDLWKNHFNKDTDVDPSNPFGCCSVLDSVQQTSGIKYVRCITQGDTAKVIALDWHSKSLSGTIPESFGDLVNLERLDLDYNDFSGPIPPEIGNLVNLQHLELDHNDLSGSIPASFGNLQNLEILRLHDNQLSGCLPCNLGKLTAIEDFDLSDNIFEETDCTSSMVVLNNTYACEPEPPVETSTTEEDEPLVTTEEEESSASSSPSSSTVTPFTQTVTVKVSCSTVLEPKLTVSCSTAVASKTSVHDGAVSTCYVTETLSNSQDNDGLIIGSTSKVSISVSVLLGLVLFLI